MKPESNRTRNCSRNSRIFDLRSKSSRKASHSNHRNVVAACNAVLHFQVLHAVAVLAQSAVVAVEAEAQALDEAAVHPRLQQVATVPEAGAGADRNPQLHLVLLIINRRNHSNVPGQDHHSILLVERAEAPVLRSHAVINNNSSSRSNSNSVQARSPENSRSIFEER